MKTSFEYRKKKQGVRLLAGVLSAGMILSLSACSTGEKGSESEMIELIEPQGAGVVTETVQKRDLRVMSTSSASLTVSSEDLSFSGDGRFDKYEVSLGEFVKEGTVLARLITKDQEKEIEDSEKKLEELTADYASANQMTELDIAIARQEIAEYAGAGMAAQVNIATNQLNKRLVEYQIEKDRQQEELTELQTRIEELRESISHAELVAPCDGTMVSRRDLRYGGNVSAETLVISFAPSGEPYQEGTKPVYHEDQFRIVTSAGDFVTERYLTKQCVDHYALIDGKRLELEYIPYSEDQSKAYSLAGLKKPTVYAVKDAGDCTLEVGDYVMVCYVTDQVLDTVAVSKDALLREGRTYYVYVLENGEQKRRDVEIGITNGIYTQILSGLEEGDVVYVQNK
ncbi:MAG: hypothetical protein J5825_06805 [Lachnospiraceae bacterium]|nr:hypothetical protein [Lachnospiraceae bacterium]